MDIAAAEERLRPFLESEGPDQKGEWPFHCLIHTDLKRSASLNFQRGVWFCHACDRGGNIQQLLNILDQKDSTFIPDSSAASNGKRPATGATDNVPAPLPSAGTVHGWASALLANGAALAAFRAVRGLSVDIIERYKIGIKSIGNKLIYTLPIYDVDSEIINIRFYDLTPGSDRRKIWGVTGRNTPELFPIEQLQQQKIVICEGEWDALASIQNGVPAITRTGAAKVWKPEWTRHFQGKEVYLCHDMDKDGQSANKRLGRVIRRVAEKLGIIKLPYAVTEKHGKDITDFYVDGNTADDFWRLARSQPVAVPVVPVVDLEETQKISIHGSKTMSTTVNMQSVNHDTFAVPKTLKVTCDAGLGQVCPTCPIGGGSFTQQFFPDDAVLLNFMGIDVAKRDGTIRKHLGLPKCPALNFEIEKYWDLSLATVRSSVDHAATDQARPVVKRVAMVGTYLNSPNTVFKMVGNIYPDPKSQVSTFQVSEVVPALTSIDSFVMTPDIRRKLKVFQPDDPKDPLAKAYEISDDIAQHVTKIYGRPEMHVLMDLVYHSVLAFNFAGGLERRGWLDALIIGDTRTGKSEAARSLVMHYQAGEMVNCESATFAGIIGGLQQVVGNKWEVSWGVIPQNDRRLVTLDEASSLSPDQYAQLSDVRSSGEASMVKIQQDKVQARTRLLWIANPRQNRRVPTAKIHMDTFSFGVQAIAPLVVNPEDIARFDLAMAVYSDDVSSYEINTLHSPSPQIYTSDLCNALVLWAWSRTANQVVWTRGAVNAALKAALELGDLYIEDPPLIQKANARIKVARIATALAARTFSTDEEGQRVVVRTAHVNGALQFIDDLYSAEKFGYKRISRKQRDDITKSTAAADEAKEFVYGNEGLAELLFEMGEGFRTVDIQERLSVSKDAASGIVKQLAEYKMIIRSGPQNIIRPILREIAKELVTR